MAGLPSAFLPRHHICARPVCCYRLFLLASAFASLGASKTHKSLLRSALLLSTRLSVGIAWGNAILIISLNPTEEAPLAGALHPSLVVLIYVMKRKLAIPTLIMGGAQRVKKKRQPGFRTRERPERTLFPLQRSTDAPEQGGGMG